MRLSSRKMAEQALHTGRYKYYRVRINLLGYKGIYEMSRVKALKIGKCLRVIPDKIGSQNNNNLHRQSLIRKVADLKGTPTFARRLSFCLPETKYFYIARASTASTFDIPRRDYSIRSNVAFFRRVHFALTLRP